MHLGAHITTQRQVHAFVVHARHPNGEGHAHEKEKKRNELTRNEQKKASSNKQIPSYEYGTY